MDMKDNYSVRKLNPAGQEVWRYSGKVIEQGEGFVRLEALFNREDMPFHGLVLQCGDRFVESFFGDRWFNIFEMHNHQDQSLKGWYCNITRPALIEQHQVTYIDLALDLLVFPDRRQLVLDDDEFSALKLDAVTHRKAISALQELQDLFAHNRENAILLNATSE
jgi:predicted RNA-binding protein associated with RNAse of E/G family